MTTDGKAKNPLKIEDLYAAFHAANNIVLKKYVAELSSAPCIELCKELQSIEPGSNVCLYRISKIVYDKNENIRDKLTTVYSTMFSMENCSLVMLINGHSNYVDLYVGFATRKTFINPTDEGTKLIIDFKDLKSSGNALKNTFIGNFPGTELIVANNVTCSGNSANPADQMGKKDIIQSCLKDAKYIAAVSSIPAIRNAEERKNQEFIQGLEKLIDTLKGSEYSAFIISDAVSNSKIEQMCAEYEDLYSQLAPFKASSKTVNAQTSSTDTESIINGVTNTVNETLTNSLTHSTSVAKTHTDSLGGSISASGSFFGLFGADYSVNYNHAYSRTKATSDATTNTTSTGTAKSLTEQNSVAKALSTTTGESIQINYDNRAVKTLLDKIDEQIQRMRSCEDFGMFDSCVYFASKDKDVAVAAANAFKSLTRGENSSVESAAVNIWHKEYDVKFIKQYLERFYHPEFVSFVDKEHHYPTTAAVLVSGKEMAYQMALPKKSIAGVPVVECTEFGREIVSLNGTVGDVDLGNIFHMHSIENAQVALNAANLTAHTFITGSTGSGKSTTIYRMLDELSGMRTRECKDGIKFMVIEPAKGEYKYDLGQDSKFAASVYGTNPNISKLLRINPFRFPNGKVHIYEHLDRLTEIFNVCWPMYAAMPAVLKAAMENAYRSAGWNLVKSENKYGDIFPSFADVATEVERYIDQSQYSAENKSNYKGSLLTRLESLTNGINSLIFTSDDIDDRDLFDENVIVDLSRVGSMETKALIMGILVLKMQEYRISTAVTRNADLKHVTVLEEAHNLLKRTSTEQSSESANLLGKSVEMLANAIAEMRTYGEGFIIADQSPGLLDISVIRNTNTKIIMRLPDLSDRELVGKAAGLNDDQIIELAKLPRGVAAVYQSDWVGPVLCKVKKPDLTNNTVLGNDSPVKIEDNCSLLLDLLDSDFRTKLDDPREEENFRQAILKSSISTSAKCRLLDYLSSRNTSKSIRTLASVVFDHFENTKQTLERTSGELNASDLKTAITAELIPSVMDYDDEQLNLLIALIIKAYINRYHMDYPVWNDFTTRLERGEVI